MLNRCPHCKISRQPRWLQSTAVRVCASRIGPIFHWPTQNCDHDTWVEASWVRESRIFLTDNYKFPTEEIKNTSAHNSNFASKFFKMTISNRKFRYWQKICWQEKKLKAQNSGGIAHHHTPPLPWGHWSWYPSCRRLISPTNSELEDT